MLRETPDYAWLALHIDVMRFAEQIHYVDELGAVRGPARDKHQRLHHPASGSSELTPSLVSKRLICKALKSDSLAGANPSSVVNTKSCPVPAWPVPTARCRNKTHQCQRRVVLPRMPILMMILRRKWEVPHQEKRGRVVAAGLYLTRKLGYRSPCRGNSRSECSFRRSAR